MALRPMGIRATGLYGSTGAMEERSLVEGHPRAEKGERFPSLFNPTSASLAKPRQQPLRSKPETEPVEVSNFL